MDNFLIVDNVTDFDSIKFSRNTYRSAIVISDGTVKTFGCGTQEVLKGNHRSITWIKPDLFSTILTDGSVAFYQLHHGDFPEKIMIDPKICDVIQVTKKGDVFELTIKR